MKKGSITVFMSLMLMLILSLLMVSYTSARTSAGRALAANALDESTFSLFGHYDRTLLDEYDLFFFDAGYRTGNFLPEAICDYLEEETGQILNPISIFGGSNLIPCRVNNVTLTGFTTATDRSGEIYAEQAIEAVRETGLLSELAAISNDISQKNSACLEAENQAINAEAGHAEFPQTATGTQGSDLPEAGNADSSEAEGTGSPATDGMGENASSPNVPDDFTDPRETIKEVRHLSVMNFVYPHSDKLSDRTVAASTLLDHRQKQSGFGVISCREDMASLSSKLLFDYYLVDHFGCLTSPEGGNGLQYPLEQILMGKNSDTANVESVVKRLLLIREGINIAAIESEAPLKAQMQSCAASISALILLPELEPLIEAFLTAGWAYCESLLDVRSLCLGSKVPAIKTAENWQVSLASLPKLLTEPDSLRKADSSGLTYAAYLNILLLSRSMSDKISRSMDMIEHEIRQNGNPGFRFDLCLDSLTVEMTLSTTDNISLTATRSVSYRDL